MLENFRSQKIIWDRANKTIFEKIEANSGDSNGRKLVVQVVNQGVTENLSGTSLSLGWKYRKGAKGLDAFDVVDASKGIFEIYYTTEMLSNIGNIGASLILTDSTGRIESSTFTISVTPSTVDDESVESENSFTALTEALVKVNEWNGRIDDVEQDYANRAEALEETYAPRLNEVAAQLAQTSTQEQVNAMLGNITDGTPVFADDVSAMTDSTRLYVNGQDGEIYAHNGVSWTTTGILYQAVGLGKKSVKAFHVDESISQAINFEESALNYGATHRWITEWESGSIAGMGTEVANTSRARTKEFLIPKEDFKVIFPNIYKVTVVNYDYNGVYLGSNAWENADFVIPFQTNRKYRFIVAYVSEDAVSDPQSVGNNIVILEGDASLMFESITKKNMTKLLDLNVEVYDGGLIEGYFFDASGTPLKGSVDYGISNAIYLTDEYESEITLEETTGKLIDFGTLTAFIYLDENETTGVRVTDYIVYNELNTIKFIVPKGYKILRMIVKRSEFGDLSKSIIVKQKKEFEDVYVNKNELVYLKESILSETVSAPPVGNLMQIFPTYTTIGDSLTAGYMNINGVLVGSVDAAKTKNNWPGYLSLRTGLTFNNVAIGNTTARDWRNTHIVTANLPTDCYIIRMGVNDHRKGLSVGSSSDISIEFDNNADSFYGNYDFLVRKVKEYNPNAKVFVFTLPAYEGSGAESYNTAIRHISNLYPGVHLIDLYNDYYTEYTTGFIADNFIGGHLSPLAYNYESTLIEKEINRYIYDNFNDFITVPYA